MLNYRPVGYLDLNRYINMLEGNYYLSFYNPVYLFIWKDYLKTNIYFHEKNVFFRIYIPDFGFSYFSPNNDNIKLFINEVIENAKEEGTDPNIGPISVDEIHKYKELDIKLIENSLYNSSIYKIEDFAFLKKKYKKALKLYDVLNKGYYYKFIQREDLPIILEYISSKLDSKDKMYFPTLNMLKCAFEHLYELKIEGYLLIDKDNHIKAFLLSSFNKKVVFIHKIIYDTFDDFLSLISFYAKKCANVVSYMNIEEEGINYLLKNDGYISPSLIEKFYAKYNL